MEVKGKLKLANKHYSSIRNNPIKGIKNREYIVLYNFNKL
jgi:hypothetical protein